MRNRSQNEARFLDNVVSYDHDEPAPAFSRKDDCAVGAQPNSLAPQWRQPVAIKRGLFSRDSRLASEIAIERR